MIKSILVLGAGSAGLLAAIALKRKIPNITVKVLRSPEISVIGVGESTTPQFPSFIFQFLGISQRHFYEMANPTWKLGIHFLWGPRKSFPYSFDLAMDAKWSDLPKPNGFYCNDDFSSANLSGALMSQGKVFLRDKIGAPAFSNGYAFHLYNPQLVTALENFAQSIGIEFIDGKTTSNIRGPKGIEAVILEDGQKIEADFFIDASGFRSELLGRTLQEPFISYSSSLFCDRAIVGSWDRTPSDYIYPYTIAETMDAGWAWSIDHQHAINRGYVYSSRFISDNQARDEFARKNPRAKIADRVIKFSSGRYRRGWVDNVFAVGNANGFVEPLEATALMILCGQCQSLVEFLQQSNLEPTDTMRNLYNHVFGETWDDIRDFLALHYRFNTRIDTPFWRTCWSEVDVSGTCELRKFYAENGPTGLCRHLLRTTPGTQNQFGVEGYLVILVGNNVPYKTSYEMTDKERMIWKQHQANFTAQAMNGISAQEAMQFIKHPQWRWIGET